ncbi:hypothetical protein Egran_02795 [Elaphomyces granulatus]|uniref:LRR-containing protein second PH domain-containing protein n=1 Tax=Elaphomyces granulatus TaxID=519963 RepID=A0A232LZ97_9EURO|nr:hypothetical protein Egran_02795 [Elaphomyces granulatus]
MAEQLEKRARRKSLGMLGSSPFASLSTTVFAHDQPSSDGLGMKNRRHSSFFPGRSMSPARASSPLAMHRPSTAGSDAVDSVKSISITPAERLRSRRKSLQKSKRTSMFGSLRSLHSEDGDKSPGGHRSKGSSGDEEDLSSLRNGLGHVVVHHGDVHTTGGMWRKRNQYLVLTDSHLIRFRSQGRAADMFSSIMSSGVYSSAMKRQSIGSLQEVSLVINYNDTAGIPLNSIVAVYCIEDSRAHPVIEISYLDERTHRAAFMSIQLSDPQESNLWLMGIRSGTESIRRIKPFPYEQRAVEYVARVLDQERDYDPQNFVIFRVVQRSSSSKMSGRASSDDLSKVSPTACYLAIGAHKVHLVPLQKHSSRSSMVSLSDFEMGMSFGLMTLTSLWMHPLDDTFQLSFRLPFRTPVTLHLASVSSRNIALWIRQRSEFLRPLWLRQPFDLAVPREIADDDMIPSVDLSEDYGCFDRTLVAYSAGYDIDTSNIRYSIDVECEDAPCVRLLLPASKQQPKYTALELLAVMRALRYNESFASISFGGINLDILQGVRDPFGLDVDAQHTRSGDPIHVAGQDQLSVLSQEIRALALKSKRLRRLDFSSCLTRIPSLDNDVRDPGCGIPEAIFPLCRRQLTNVDWIVLNGIKLGESDLDYLVDAASQRTSHLRALEVGNCGLAVHDLDLILSTITAQEATLEAINISGAQGRLSPELFQQQIGFFGQIRKIDLSRVARTSGPEPLIAPETLLNWRLEELSLSRTAVNQETVDSIAAYLASEMSLTLRALHLDQCGLTGKDVAIFLRSMTTRGGRPRNLHLYVSENRLDTNYSLLFDSIGQNQTPTHLSMRMIDFKKEEHFRELLVAMGKNTSLKYLDISKASLPYDAGPETSRSLQVMFEQNSTLEELDISGEHAHLDVARFGIGLNQALTGLKKNKTLKVLRIEHQKLGLQGANTLASVLEANHSICEVYCENNDINLQSFTVLVNGLKLNKSVLYLPSMDSDRHQSLEKIRREAENVHRESGHTSKSAASSLRRSIHAAISVGQPAGGHKLSKHQSSSPVLQQGVFPGGSSTSHSSSHSPSSCASPADPVDQDVDIALSSIKKRWNDEVARLHQYLLRNFHLAHGISVSTEEDQMLPTKGIGAEASSTPLNAEVKNAKNGLDGVFLLSTLPKNKGSVPNDAHSSLQRNLEGYVPSSTPSSRLAIPIPALQPVNSTPSSIRSTCSSSTVSTSTGTGSPSVRSSPGLASSSLRRFLAGRGPVIKGLRQIEKSEMPIIQRIDQASDEPPRIIWSPPKIEF